MRRRTACCDQRGTDAHARGTSFLQPVQRFEQRLEGPGQQRLGRVVALVLLKSVQPL